MPDRTEKATVAITDDLGQKAREAAVFSAQHQPISTWLIEEIADAASEEWRPAVERHHELLRLVLTEDFEVQRPGLAQDIADVLGLRPHWRCECGDLNRYEDAFCYRCGAGKPEADDLAKPTAPKP